jgi:hypothetical protein
MKRGGLINLSANPSHVGPTVAHGSAVSLSVMLRCPCWWRHLLICLTIGHSRPPLTQLTANYAADRAGISLLHSQFY